MLANGESLKRFDPRRGRHLGSALQSLQKGPDDYEWGLGTKVLSPTGVLC
jgi:hypothetical protein